MRRLPFAGLERWLRHALPVLAALLAFPLPAAADSPEVMTFTNALVIGGVGRSGRDTVHTDAVEAQLVMGQWRTPQAGDKLIAPDDRAQVWEAVSANAEGWFEHRAFRGGYALTTITLDRPRTLILDAAGHSSVYVNGELRAGDPYANGYVQLPVALPAGPSEFLFSAARGRLRARLTEPKGPAFINPADVTLPDLVVGEREPVWASVVVVNATTNTTQHLWLEVAGAANGRADRFPVEVLPLSARKVAFQLRPPRGLRAGEFPFEVQLVHREGGHQLLFDKAALKTGVRTLVQQHRRTFVSEIDGSVQYYAVNPPPTAPVNPPALFLSLHGAGVEGSGQAASYAPKSWGVIVSPTNRRPFGFDWEEWGRLDALEVLAQAQARYHTDPFRTYLTGHSMGGHGTWSVGATFPDQFAAIAPSAGWISFRTYARGGRTNDDNGPMAVMLRRAAASSDTFNLVSNYVNQAVYVLHGDADDNVPVSEARAMRERIAGFHHDLHWYEQPGAGHWWDASDEPGTDCVDWLPMFDLFARRRLPALNEAREVRFTTVNPGVSSRCRWLAIEQQIHPLEPSHIVARFDPGQRRIVARTENVARLSFDLTPLFTTGAPIQLELDGIKLTNVAWSVWAKPATGRPVKSEVATPLALARGSEGWAVAGPASPAQKNPRRYGPLREAFTGRVLFVYATQGDAAENAWALAKARYDAESFWYRGNGSIDVVPDTAYVAHPERFTRPDGHRRSVILYGHAQANAAWAGLLGASPVQVRRGGVQIGERMLAGDQLAVLFLRPMPGDDLALAGVVAGTGAVGARLAERLPVFLAGPGFPDCLVVDPTMLAKGVEGVQAAGFFGTDWGVGTGEFVWAAEAKR